MSQTLVTTIWSNPHGLYAVEFWANDDGTYDVLKVNLEGDIIKYIGENLHKLNAHLAYKSFINSGTEERSV